MAIVTLVTVCAVLFARSPNREQKALAETRRTLRQQGFKTDLADFDFSTSDELRARAAVLGTTSRAALTNRSRPEPILGEAPAFMRPVEPDAAIVVWKLDKLDDYSGRDLWPELRDRLTTNQTRIAAARQASLSGPIRFEPIGGPGMNALLPYLAEFKNLVATFGAQTILALHDGDMDSAWTNLHAAGRFATVYVPEPIEISHLVRFACGAIAYDITWNALQSGNWADGQLAELQREWESADFFNGLPETAAHSRAGSAAMCRMERREPLEMSWIFKEVVRSPRSGLSLFADQWRRIQYRHHGSFEDEKNILLYYRDREVELRRAVQSPSWADMRQLPGVTNYVPFQSKPPSRIQTLLNQRQLMLGMQGRGLGILARASEAETRRRLLVTAIALERFHGRHGSYPKTLSELAPEWLKNPPVDFMDGQPIRYRLTDDGHFVLYSVGLDGVDNGGEMRRPRRASPGGAPYEDPREFGFRQGVDLVWPRPASAAEVAAFRRAQINAERERANQAEDFAATEQWRRTARRQAETGKILAAKPLAQSKEPSYRGHPLAEVLRNETALGTNKLTLDELLTLKQVITGAEPEIVTFEVPMAHEVVTNLGELSLFIDPSKDEDSDEGCNVGWLECHRATNGNCQLVWNTIYESPGKHALQMGLALNGPASRDEGLFLGPPAPFVVSNLCQFSLSSAHFERDLGVTLHAKLPEPDGAYAIELKATGGPLVRTFTGSTSNGVIKVHWDLTDERGIKCTNDSFDSVFRITLPDSGRSQTMKGP